MAFKVVIFIEGVGTYVPHTDGKKLLVLFPEQGPDDAPKAFSPLTGKSIGQHHLGVQFHAQMLDRTYPDTLLTLNA